MMAFRFFRRRSAAPKDSLRTVVPVAPGQTWRLLQPSKAQRTIQALLGVGLVALIGVNVWSLTHPPETVHTPQSFILPDTLGVDTAGAVGVAETAAWAFLNLDDETTRTQRLQTVWADPTSTWNGVGQVNASPQTHTVKTIVKDASSVDVLVAVYTEGADDSGLEAGWVGVLVPVSISDGGAFVAKAPTIVGLPAPVSLAAERTPETDSELTSTTRADIDAFFKAWADGDVSAVSAPGAIIPAPRSSLGRAEVVHWRAFEGEGPLRRGSARVAWTIGQATLTCDYTLSLVQVSTGSSSRWQVASIEI